MPWVDFMFELSKCKYGVQAYPASAGQFPLNCAYLGIPCIGYNDVNTQMHLHRKTSVERGDVITARKLANKLKNDEEFYLQCSLECKEAYSNFYSETVFINKVNEILKS